MDLLSCLACDFMLYLQHTKAVQYWSRLHFEWKQEETQERRGGGALREWR